MSRFDENDPKWDEVEVDLCIGDDQVKVKKEEEWEEESYTLCGDDCFDDEDQGKEED